MFKSGSRGSNKLNCNGLLIKWRRPISCSRTQMWLRVIDRRTLSNKSHKGALEKINGPGTNSWSLRTFEVTSMEWHESQSWQWRWSDFEFPKSIVSWHAECDFFFFFLSARENDWRHPRTNNFDQQTRALAQQHLWKKKEIRTTNLHISKASPGVVVVVVGRFAHPV